MILRLVAALDYMLVNRSLILYSIIISLVKKCNIQISEDWVMVQWPVLGMVHICLQRYVLIPLCQRHLTHLCQAWQSFHGFQQPVKKRCAFDDVGKRFLGNSEDWEVSLSLYIYTIHMSIYVNAYIYIYTYWYTMIHLYIYIYVRVYVNHINIYIYIQKWNCAQIHVILIFEGQTSQVNPVDMGECDRTDVLIVIFQCHLNLNFWCKPISIRC